MSDSISREEVLDEINRIGVGAFTDYASYSNFFDFVSDLPTVERPQGEWIPVSERLPDIAKKCIVQLTDGHITIGSYHSIDKWTFQETSVRYSYPKESVIAWQLLPELYKKEAENETDN